MERLNVRLPNYEAERTVPMSSGTSSFENVCILLIGFVIDTVISDRLDLCAIIRFVKAKSNLSSG